MDYKKQAYNAAKEIIEIANLKAGQILVVGCSTSEILGEKIGTDSSPDTAKEIFAGIYAAAEEKGVFIAAQCCEHLNRAVLRAFKPRNNLRAKSRALCRACKRCAVSESRRLICNSGIRRVFRPGGT